MIKIKAVLVERGDMGLTDIFDWMRSLVQVCDDVSTEITLHFFFSQQP